MPIGKPQVVVWLVPSASFRELFLILNEDRNEYINEHISDTVTIELRCGQAQDLPEKPC